MLSDLKDITKGTPEDMPLDHNMLNDGLDSSHDYRAKNTCLTHSC